MNRVVSNEWPPFRPHATPPFLDPVANWKGEDFVKASSIGEVTIDRLDRANDTVIRITRHGNNFGSSVAAGGDDILDRERCIAADSNTGCIVAGWNGISDEEGTGHSQQITARHDRNAKNGGRRKGILPGGVKRELEYHHQHQEKTISVTVSGTYRKESSQVSISSSHLSPVIGRKQDTDERDALIAVSSRMDTERSRRYNSQINDQTDYVFHRHPRQNGILVDHEDDDEEYVDSDRDEDSLVHLRRRAQHDREFSIVFQPQCMDSSMYETYDDLSSLLGADLAENVLPSVLSDSGEFLNANNSSSTSASFGSWSLEPGITTKLNSRLAKSAESIHTCSDAEGQGGTRTPSDLGGEPLQRSRSLESLNFLRGEISSTAPSRDGVPASSQRSTEEATNNNNNASSRNNSSGRSASDLRSACANQRLITTDASVARENIISDSREEVTAEIWQDCEGIRSFAEEVRLCALPVYIPPATDRMYQQHQRVPSPLIEMDEDEDDEDAVKITQGIGIKERSKESASLVEDKAAPPKPRRGEERQITSDTEANNDMVKITTSSSSSSPAVSPSQEPASVKDSTGGKFDRGSNNTDGPRTGEDNLKSKMAATTVTVPQIVETLVEDDEDNEGERIVLQLQSRLRAVEKLAEDLSNQNAKLQEELTEMRLEVEESTDKYREGGEIEEYREMKMELDRTVRDCRILQYRLRKAERKNEDLDQERIQWEERLRASAAGLPGPLSCSSARSSGDSSPAEEARLGEIAELQQELRTAKDVSIRLHQELEMIEEKRAKTEDECQILRRKLVDSENTRKEMKRELEKARTEVEVIKRKLKQSQDHESSKKLQTKIAVLRASTSSDSDSEVEYDVSALLNDLQESTERERDLQHQLQLVEEEANAIRKNLALVEQEKEELDFELERFKMRFGTLDEPKRPENGRGASTEKEAELRLQLMLVEQEATVMRRKMRELDMKNEELECALDRQRGAMASSAGSLDKPPAPEGDEKRQDVEDMVAECSALKRQMEDVLRENEALRVKLETFEELNTLYPPPGTNQGGGDEDLEAHRLRAQNAIASLKRRLVDAEFENRSLQLETESLRKLSEIAAAKEPGKGSKIKGAEHKLRSQIALLKTEADSMRRKIVSLEELNERLEEAAEKASVSAARASTSPERDRNPEPITRQESTSSTTSEADNERLQVLQTQIGTLQEELGDLLLIIKSKEVTQEQQEKELVQTRQEVEQLRTDNANLKESLKRRLRSLSNDKDLLEQRLSISEERSERLEEDLKRACAVIAVVPDNESPTEGGDAKTEAPTEGAGAKIEAPVGGAEAQTRELASDDVFTEPEGKPEVKVNFETCLKQRIATLEAQLAEERQRCRVAEKKAQMLDGGASGVDVEGGLQVSQSEDATFKEREKELLRFELTECHLAIDDLTTELARERERHEQEKAEMNRRLAESLQEKERTEKRAVFEQESADLQKKMETMAWRREKAELSKRLDELKRKMDDMQPRSGEAAVPVTGKEEPKQDSSAQPDLEKQELKKILSKLETEVDILDGECWKYRELAEEMQAKMKVMTAQTEELKASNDILNQERTVLHAKISAVQQERTEADIRLKKEREVWKRERSELVARQDARDQENARKLSDIQHEFGQFQLEKRTLQQRTLELETNMKKLKSNEKEREAKLKEAESQLEHMQASYRAKIAKHKEQLCLTASEGRLEMDEKDLELKSKSRQLEEVTAKVELMEHELEQSRGTIHALDAQLRAQEDSRSKEKAELLKSARNGEDELRTENCRLGTEIRDLQAKLANREKDWKAERSELQEALEKLKSSLKARDASWESDRSKIVADVKSLQTSLMTREDAWKVERTQYINSLSDLRGKLREAQTSAEKKTTDLMSRIEAATELVETHKVSEAKFKEERRRLLKQIEDKENDLKGASKDIERYQRQLENQSRRIENAKLEIQAQFQRDEKIWKAEISASRFKLEAETKYFKEELARMETRLGSEVKERLDTARDLQAALKESQEQKVIAERAVADKMAARQTAEKETLSAKRSKQLADELQRDRRELSSQLTAERERCDALQRSYANEKASWDVKRNELMAKVGKLEQQTKLKKVKLEDLQVRLQAAWDIERADNRRLVAEANQNALETRRQADARESKMHRELSAAQEKFAKEKKEWEEDKRQLSEAIKELEDQMQTMKDLQKRSSQLETRYQHDKELWRSERADLQKRLQGSLTSRRLEHNRIEAMILELQKLRMQDMSTSNQTSPEITTPGSPVRSYPTSPPTKGVQELRITESITSNEKATKKEKSDLVRRMQEKVLEHDGNDGTAHAQEVPDVIKASDSMSANNAFDEVASSEKDYRSKSHSDVAKAASLVRYTKPVCQIAKQYEDSATSGTTETSSIQIITTERPPFEGSKRDSRPLARSAEILTSSSPKPRRKQSPEKQPARAQTPEPKTSTVRVHLAQRLCSTPPGPSRDDEASEHGSSSNSNTNSASSSPSISEKQRESPLGKINTKPVLTRFGRFDGQSMLRETDRKTSPVTSDPDTKIEADLDKRLAELEKSRVMSTKKIFEQNLARGAGTLPGRALSPRKEFEETLENDRDRDRHTDSELYSRTTNEQDVSKTLPSGKDSAPSDALSVKGVSAPCDLDSESAKNTPTSKTREVSRSQQIISPSTSKPPLATSVPARSVSSSPDVKASSPGGSPRLPRSVSNYPCAPPGFLLPKKMSEVHASNSKRAESGLSPAQSPPPTWRHSTAAGKNFNIPLPPYQFTAMQNTESLSVLPGQLPRTKSQMQAKARPMSEVHQLLQNISAPSSDSDSPGTRRKRISPRSARANFFADLPPSLLMQQQQTTRNLTENIHAASASTSREPNNNNNNPCLRPSQLNVSGTNKNETVGGATASQSSPKTHSPPSKSSLWSASPAISLPRHHSRIETDEHSHKVVETEILISKRPSATVSPTRRVSSPQTTDSSPKSKKSIISKQIKKRPKSADGPRSAAPPRCVTFASPTSPINPLKPNTTRVTVVSSKKTEQLVEMRHVVNSSTSDKGVASAEKSTGKQSQEVPLKPAPTVTFDEMLPSHDTVPALTARFPRPSPSTGRRLPARWQTASGNKRLRTDPGTESQPRYYPERRPSGSSLSDCEWALETELHSKSNAKEDPGNCKRKRGSVETTV